ncbi:hypothetical protein ACKFRN_01990 [Corynebacterium kefirresidentii]|uniref:hypothetical protein n=1 Tax=Corynebacterium kefirresidentii TaxID=1979527 RepID=UPI0038D1691F
MGRIILLLLFVLAAYLVWKAFGPSTWKKREVDQPRAIKGPDDDEEFLWNLEKERFKQRRAQEAEEENAASAAIATPTARRIRIPSARSASPSRGPRPRR